MTKFLIAVVAFNAGGMVMAFLPLWEQYDVLLARQELIEAQDQHIEIQRGYIKELEQAVFDVCPAVNKQRKDSQI